MKKIFSVMILAAALILICGQEKVFAYDVYCGTYRDGNKAYLMSETVRGNYQDFTCRVKAVKNGTVTVYIDYHFFWHNAAPYYSNSQGFEGYLPGRGDNNPKAPIANAIHSEATKFLNS